MFRTMVVGVVAAVGMAVVTPSAWVEAYPEPALELPLDVFPGDTITAKVKLKDGKFSFTTRNATRGEEVSSWAPCDLPGNSAEAVIEAPEGYQVRSRAGR